MAERARRQTSFGGQVVDRSLTAAGYETATPGVSLVESAALQGRYSALLVQNAWNVLPRSEFSRMLAPYPPGLVRRAWARRWLARWNIRRADKVVCLTRSVAQMLRDDMGVDAEVAAVTAPVDDWAEPSIEDALAVALVPGTVTWYKRPVAALEWLATAETGTRHVIYCGKDDGSGCWREVTRSAGGLGLTVERTTVPHRDLYRLYASASVVLLPSALESLGFGLSEALLHARRVVASPIAPHREIAARTGGPVEWWGQDASMAGDPADLRITLAEAMAEWRAAGEALGLDRLASPT